MVGLTGANWAACSAGLMGVPLVVAMEALTVVHWVEQLAGEKDRKTAVLSVDLKVAMWVVLTEASLVVHSADYWDEYSVAVWVAV